MNDGPCCQVIDTELWAKILVVNEESYRGLNGWYYGLVVIPHQHKDIVEEVQATAYLGEIEGKHSEVICDMKFVDMTTEEVHKFILDADFWCATEMLEGLKHALSDEGKEDVYKEILEANKDFFSRVKLEVGRSITVDGKVVMSNTNVENTLDFEWL